MRIRPYPHKQPKQKRGKLEGYGSIQELAEYSGVSERTLYRLRSEGKIKSWRQVSSRVVLYHLARCVKEIQ
jgi:excisionase family DNA binding protein